MLRVDSVGVNYFFVRSGEYGSENYLCRDGEIRNWYKDNLDTRDVKFPSEELAEKAKKEYEVKLSPGLAPNYVYARAGEIANEATRDKIHVMTAYLLRKPIEVAIRGTECDIWHDVTHEPNWNWKVAIWRIKE